MKSKNSPNLKKMYFFKPSTSILYVVWLMLRMIGCLLIGQKIWGFSHWEDNNQLNIYFYRKQDGHTGKSN